MKQWNISWNIENKKASYELEEGPFWAFWLSYDFCFCHWKWLHKIKLPRWWFITIKESGEQDQRYSLRDWYGDLGSVMFGCVELPLFEWSQKFLVSYFVEIDFETAKNRHREEFERIVKLQQGDE